MIYSSKSSKISGPFVGIDGIGVSFGLIAISLSIFKVETFGDLTRSGSLLFFLVSLCGLSSNSSSLLAS